MTYPIWKRAVDIFGALAGLLLIAPLVPLRAIAIKLNSSGGVFVKLDRVSEGKLIKVYKLRSMSKNALNEKHKLLKYNERKDGPFFKMRHDPRITKVGHLLRKFRIDEFPQLLNVLKGELALVGPRPHEPGEVVHYPNGYKDLLMARAGVTGLSQVNGASSLSFLKELELDTFYIKHVSLLLDVKIIIRTLLVLFFDPTAV